MRNKKPAAPAQLSRRMFLRGAGGALLALPILPSLLTPKEAEAQTTSMKFFAHMRTPHGGVRTGDMWPTGTLGTSTFNPTPSTDSTSYTYPVRSGSMAAYPGVVNPVNGNTFISNVLQAPAGVLTPALVNKLNILRGLDIPTAIGHNFAGGLGYYDQDQQAPPTNLARATIDQIMAYSPSFYPSLGSVRARAVTCSLTDSGVHGYKTPGVPSSGVNTDSIGGVQSSSYLFQTLLAGGTSTATPGAPMLVDRVLDSYKRLQNGGRLSSLDSQRLEQHVEAVQELQRSLQTTLGASCTIPPAPTTDNQSLLPMDGNPVSNVKYFQMIHQFVAIAMNCGATQIFTNHIDEDNQGSTFTTTPAAGQGWHLNVAHEASSTDSAEALNVQCHQTFFSGVFLDFANRLDSFPDGMGGTLLDHALVTWTHECGNVTHMPFSIPVITAGSAGGFLKTGNYCDYRNLTLNTPGNALSGDSSTGNEVLYSGLIFNQWLGTALQAMGIPSSEWATESNHPGYGARVTYQDYGLGTGSEYFFTNVGLNSDLDCYTNAMWQKTAQVLPFL
jgi:hypothetical protein